MITSQIVIGLGMRPCAPCGAYVQAESCAHWRPVAAAKATGKKRTTGKRSDAYLARKRERDKVSARDRRARQRENEWRARENARAAVEEFRRVMTRG